MGIKLIKPIMEFDEYIFGLHTICLMVDEVVY